MDEDKLFFRKIIHIDMDAFYASVEQRDYPEYRGIPIAVGGSPDKRGVVMTASYEARKFGVRSAMSSRQARQLCPQLLFVNPRFSAYHEASAHIREIFSRYTDIIEPLSLDEAYLDVTVDKQNIGSALTIAGQIRESIREELMLTASAGISINKFVAKIASDINKPDGLTFIGPSTITGFMEKLPIEKFYGVGKVTAAKMKQMGIHTGLDLKQYSEQQLFRYFGKTGLFYYQICRGIDNRPVEPNRETKSLGAEDTFLDDLTEISEMHRQLEKIADTVNRRLRNSGLAGKTITVKIKYHDFKTITRNRTLSHRTNDLDTILAVAKELLAATVPENSRIRLLGITLSNFNEIQTGTIAEDDNEQLSLF